MIPVAPDPVLINIGRLSIRYYGLVYALGFLFTYWYLAQLSKRGKLKLTVDQVESFLIYSILGTVLGGRIGEFIFFQTDVLLSNPLQILRIWEGGMAFHGAILGIAISTTLFCRKHKISFYALTDHLVLPGAIALFFGRIANFINAELVGTISNVPWCVNWYGERGLDGNLICRHPSQLYEAAKNLLIAGVLFFMQYDAKGKDRHKRYRPGYLTWLFVLMYGVLRTFVNIWREDVRFILGLSTGQILSSIMAIIALIVLYTQYWKKK